MAQDIIQRELDAAEREYASLSDQLRKLEVKMHVAAARRDALCFALEAIGGSAPSPKREEQREPRNRQRNRGPSADWQMVFQLLAVTGPSVFGYDDIEAAATSLNIQANRASLRSRMMNYANEGHVTRTGNGQFEFTDAGREYFQIGSTAPNGNGAAHAAPLSSEGSSFSTAPSQSEFESLQ